MTQNHRVALSLNQDGERYFFLEIYPEGILEGAMGAISVIIIHCVLGERRNEHKSIP